MIMRGVRISNEEASEKYGCIVSGANSINRYYLREDGCVIDDTGCVRYIPSHLTYEELPRAKSSNFGYHLLEQECPEMTNGDKIRDMTDEELAHYIWKLQNTKERRDVGGWLDWLKRLDWLKCEVEDG